MSDAQKPTSHMFEFWWAEHMPRSGQRAALIAWRDATNAASGIAAPQKLTPPDGWEEAVKSAADFMEGVKDAQLQIVDMAEAILDMDKLMKEVKP